MCIKLISKAWETDFRGADLLILLALCDHADSLGQCFPSWATLMKKTKVCKGTLSYTLKALEAFSIIKREHHHRKNGSNSSNLYTITLKEIDMKAYYAYKKSLKDKETKENEEEVHSVNPQSSPNELCHDVRLVKQHSSLNELEDSSLCEIAYNESPLPDHHDNHSISTKGFKTPTVPLHFILKYKEKIIKEYRGKRLVKKVEEPWGNTIISLTKDGYLINEATQEKLTEEEAIKVWKWMFSNQDKFRKTK